VERGVAALCRFRRLADEAGVETVLAVATSAVREARNGEAFLQRVGREVGIWPRAVSGEEEARLIYLAAVHAVHLEGRRALVVDIGGGSTELALGAGESLAFAASEKLGVLRLGDLFVEGERLSPEAEARMVAHVREVAGPHLQRIREIGFDTVIGTSGTILAVGALAHRAATGEGPDLLHHLRVTGPAVHAVRKRLVASDLRERQRMPGLDAGRADIIVQGAVLVDTLLEALGATELTLCETALREGILLDHLRSHPDFVARAEACPDPRRRSVLELAERCAWDEAHARQTASLALALFDQTRALTGLGDADRDLLEYAALLHDVGHHISYPRHHRHTYYLIKNGDLRGLAPEELEMVACVARYHRRGLPRARHEGYGGLPRQERRRVRRMAALLRVADALDRSRRQVVRQVSVSAGRRRLRISCLATGDSQLEMWGAAQRKDLLEQELGREVAIVAAPVLEPVPAG